jgi:hypothetical protein
MAGCSPRWFGEIAGRELGVYTTLLVQLAGVHNKFRKVPRELL